ncbi:restriction endonuclease subunit S [Phocaeicola plebeius]|uniref:restriction endonuclease subunit S n=1 Tax=Phocaeicola plebeius TaxID=310297 RepID=UPI00320A6994
MENRYDKYKDSGIAWIGEIPEHWEVIPHKRIMRKKKIIKELYAGENILSLTKKGVIIRDLEAGGKMPTTFNGYQVLYPDNLLMCLFDIDVTPRCVGIIKDEGLSSPAYSQFVLNQLGYTPFFDYLLRYMDDEKCLLHLSKNLRNSLTEDDFGQIETILPSTQEQQSIATYLDQKCSEIDELITLQEEMITKLQSYKQSVITEAVTKGLDKNVPLKDSGIEWIGEIPEHWNTYQLKRCSKFINGYAFNSNHFNKDKGIPVIRIGDILNEQISFENIVYVQENNELEKFIVHKNDILIAMSGATVGKIGVYNSDDKVYINQRVGIIRTTQYNYIKRMFSTNGFIDYINLSSAGSAQPNISSDGILNFHIPVPPLNEQQTIANYLDQKCSEIDELISIKQQKIEKLKDYKKSLIFECVTGKRKV